MYILSINHVVCNVTTFLNNYTVQKRTDTNKLHVQRNCELKQAGLIKLITFIGDRSDQHGMLR